jgi:hypothetical protein
MIYTIISILVVFWLIGFLGHIGGDFIHGLLILALCVYIYKFITGRGAGA